MLDDLKNPTAHLATLVPWRRQQIRPWDPGKDSKAGGHEICEGDGVEDSGSHTQEKAEVVVHLGEMKMPPQEEDRLSVLFGAQEGMIAEILSELA